MNDPQEIPVSQTAPKTLISYSLHDKIVKILEAKLHDAYLERERARAERDEAKANRRYAPPMIVRFNHQLWEDGEYVVTVDGDPVGGTVTPEESKSIVRWIGTAWAELIEHNTMKHRSSTKLGLIGHNGIFAADLDDLHARHNNTHGGNP